MNENMGAIGPMTGRLLGYLAVGLGSYVTVTEHDRIMNMNEDN